MPFPQMKVAFFDVLGFKNKFESLKLQGMLERYLELVSTVDWMNSRMTELYVDKQFPDTAIWTSDGGVVILNRIHGTYASDSLVLWANHEFENAQGLSEAQKTQERKNPLFEWQYHPIPNDRLIEACNEVICHSLEVGLPLRGALAAGEAVLHKGKSIFIGQPLIDAVLMEGAQRAIGAALANSIAVAASPSAFIIPFSSHLKDNLGDETNSLFSGFVLDWPRHWRETRKSDLAAVLEALDTDKKYSQIYRNTILLVERSILRQAAEAVAFPPSARKEYLQFSHDNIALSLRLTRDEREA